MSDYIDFIETFQSGKHKDIRDYMKYSIQEEHVELEVVYGDLSDKSKYLIDQEISKVLMEANEMSYKIIEENKEIINSLIKKLKENKLLIPKDIFESMNINHDKSKYFYENNQYYRMLKENL